MEKHLISLLSGRGSPKSPARLCASVKSKCSNTFDWRYNQYVSWSFCYSSKSAAEAGVEPYTVNPPEAVLCARMQSWNCERWDFIVYPCFHQATWPQEKKKNIFRSKTGLNSNLDSATNEFCSFWQVLSYLLNSVFTSIKWGRLIDLAYLLGAIDLRAQLFEIL